MFVLKTTLKSQACHSHMQSRHVYNKSLVNYKQLNNQLQPKSVLETRLYMLIAWLYK